MHAIRQRWCATRAASMPSTAASSFLVKLSLSPYGYEREPGRRRGALGEGAAV
jgi:hypothetical protein